MTVQKRMVAHATKVRLSAERSHKFLIRKRFWNSNELSDGQYLNISDSAFQSSPAMHFTDFSVKMISHICEWIKIIFRICEIFMTEMLSNVPIFYYILWRSSRYYISVDLY